jgi:hypothetical protein
VISSTKASEFKNNVYLAQDLIHYLFYFPLVIGCICIAGAILLQQNIMKKLQKKQMMQLQAQQNFATRQ